MWNFTGEFIAKRTDKTNTIELKEDFTRNQSNINSAITHARTKITALELKTFYTAKYRESKERATARNDDR